MDVGLNDRMGSWFLMEIITNDAIKPKIQTKIQTAINLFLLTILW